VGRADLSRFNPSRGIAIIQTAGRRRQPGRRQGFNPSRGIAIIQTQPQCQSQPRRRRFNPSRGIAIIQTLAGGKREALGCAFQSLTRDSNHSNCPIFAMEAGGASFNPSRGIAIIQTLLHPRLMLQRRCFNPSRGIAIIQTRSCRASVARYRVSIPHAG